MVTQSKKYCVLNGAHRVRSNTQNQSGDCAVY